MEIMDASVAENVQNPLSPEVLTNIMSIAEQFGYPFPCGAPSMTCAGMVSSLKRGHLLAGIA